MTDETERRFEVEEVASFTPPPKARVSDADPQTPRVGDADQRPRVEDAERSRDYLSGFLAEKPQAAAPGEIGGDLYEKVIEALKEIYDPEIPVNIYDLGLVYGVDVTAGGHVAVAMTLTTPNCPVAESMPGEVELRVGSVPGVGSAEVNLVWDPPWDPQKMSDEAKLELGML
jgi:FeS assembly SUF system protein